MRIVIVGVGEVGRHLSDTLSRAGHAVTVVDQNLKRLQAIDSEQDVRVSHGSGSSAATLQSAFGDGCDCFIAMTSIDEVNLISCSLARALGVPKIISRIHDRTFIDNSLVNYSLHFGVDLMLNPEGLCAAELAKSIRHPAGIAVENFARGRIQGQRIVVDSGSRMRGKALRDLKLPPEVKFGYLQRGEYEDVPAAGTVLEDDDILTVFGPPEQLQQLGDRINPASSRGPVKIVVFGGSETAVALIRHLDHPRFQIRIIEQDEAKIIRLAERFPKVTFIHGDGTSLRLLEEENLAQADFFVASTSDDECNVMTSLQVAQMGTKHVQTVINKSDYQDILERLRGPFGIETVVSPREITAREVLRAVSTEAAIELFRFPNQQARIIEIAVPHDSPCSGRKLRELGWPAHSVIVGLLHQFTVKVPGAEDSIIGGDRIIVISRESTIPELLAIVHGRPTS